MQAVVVVIVVEVVIVVVVIGVRGGGEIENKRVSRKT